jgi:hypothetical protein
MIRSMEPRLKWKLLAGVSRITDILELFPKDYRDDYDRVRNLARSYLENEPDETNIPHRLAEALREVLVNWGAEKRKAPKLRPKEYVASSLRQAELRSLLRYFSTLRIEALGLGNGSWRCLGQGKDPKEISKFDKELISVLNRLADSLFHDNTNVTFPMKALLLLSGFMPALDNRVRDGLKRWGVAGFKTTQYLLPQDSDALNSKKLTRLPFLLGQCWQEFRCEFQDAIHKSDCKFLDGEPGRFFDVVLFMQAKLESPILQLDTEATTWYGMS